GIPALHGRLRRLQLARGRRRAGPGREAPATNDLTGTTVAALGLAWPRPAREAADGHGNPRRCVRRFGRYHGLMQSPVNLERHGLRAGMVGLGMIFDETYRPLFEELYNDGLYRPFLGFVDVELAAVASRTGARAERLRQAAAGRLPDFASFAGPDAVA